MENTLPTRDIGGPREETARIVGEIVASIRDATIASCVVGMAGLGSFVIAPTALLVMWLAYGVSFGVSLVWAVVIFVGLWAIAIGAQVIGNNATEEAADHAASRFAECFPNESDQQAQALLVLSSRIEKTAQEIQHAASAPRVPERREGMKFVGPSALTAELHLVAALGRRGIISNAEVQRLNSFVERAKQTTSNQHGEDPKPRRPDAAVRGSRPPLPPLPPQTVVAASVSATVDINSADEHEIGSLPGVGPVLAKKAIKFRQSERAFQSVDDFAQVLGLKPYILQQLRARVVANPVAQTPRTVEKRGGRVVDF